MAVHGVEMEMTRRWVAEVVKGKKTWWLQVAGCGKIEKRKVAD